MRRKHGFHILGILFLPPLAALCDETVLVGADDLDWQKVWRATNLATNVWTNNVAEPDISKLASEGKICAKLGHHWRPGRPGEDGNISFADYHPGTSFRTCTICGKCESQSLTEWK